MTETMVTFKLNGKGTGVRQDVTLEGSAHIINREGACTHRYSARPQRLPLNSGFLKPCCGLDP